MLAKFAGKDVSVNRGELTGLLLAVDADGPGWCQVDFTPRLSAATSHSNLISNSAATFEQFKHSPAHEQLCDRLDALKFPKLRGKHGLVRKVPQSSVRPLQKQQQTQPQQAQQERGRVRGADLHQGGVDGGNGIKQQHHARTFSQSPVRSTGKRRSRAEALDAPNAQSRSSGSMQSQAANHSGTHDMKPSTTMLAGVVAAVLVLVVSALLGIGGSTTDAPLSNSGLQSQSSAQQQQQQQQQDDAFRERVGYAYGLNTKRNGVWAAWPPSAAKAAASALLAQALPSNMDDGTGITASNGGDDGWGDDDMPTQTDATVLILYRILRVFVFVFAFSSLPLSAAPVFLFFPSPVVSFFFSFFPPSHLIKKEERERQLAHVLRIFLTNQLILADNY